MKMKKVLKVIGIILLILVVAVVIYFGRNFAILSKLAQVREEVFSVDNYSFDTVAINENGETTVFEYYYKDGKMLEIWKIEDKTISINWYDENTKEGIQINPNTLTADITISQKSNLFLMGSKTLEGILSDNAKGNMYRAFYSFIGTEEVEGEKCYKITPYAVITDPPSKYYFSKESGKIVKCSVAKTKIEYKNWKQNEVTDEQVARPDLTGYQITEE